MKRVLCVYLPNWPIQRLLVAQPELRDRAVVLGDANRRRVLACSRQAAKRGVRIGMPLSEVCATHGTTGQVHFSAYDARADCEALERLAVRCQRFSPVVGLNQESDEPDSLLIDESGCEQLFHSEHALAKQVVHTLQRFGFSARIVIADTVGAAWAMAHAGSWMKGVWKVIPAGRTPRALAPLPVDALRLPAERVIDLQRLGIHTIGQLERLPRAELPARFGTAVLRRLDQAMGRLAEIVVPCRPRQPAEASWAAEEPIERRRDIELVLRRLLQAVMEQLQERGEGVQTLEYRLEVEASRPVFFSISLFRPTQSLRHVMEIVRTRLERIVFPGPVTEVGIRATATGRLETRQGDLLDDDGRRSEQSLAQLVDRIGGRLGQDAIARAGLVPDPQPEYGFRYDPLLKRHAPRCKTRKALFGTGARASKAMAASAWEVRGFSFPLLRPLRLCSPPRPVEVISVVPEGPPLGVWLEGTYHEVVGRSGPERIESGWWRGRLVRRDYYRVATETGQHCWLFRSLSDGRWFLHGWFE